MKPACEDPGVVFRVVVVLPTVVTRPWSIIGALNVPDEMHEISLSGPKWSIR